jgi:hypothetical protein
LSTDFCPYLRGRLGEKLSRLGLEETGCDRFGEDYRGHGAIYAGSVIFYRGHGLLIAIPCSTGDGVGCHVGSDGDDARNYENWPSLWSVLGMDSAFVEGTPSEEAVAAYVDQFPHDLDGMADFVADKLAELLAR